MNIVRGDGRESGDEQVQRTLRELYASPSDESYWQTLERRILSAVALETPREWWSYFPGWVRFGLSAAAAAVVVASIAAWHTQAAQARIAAEQIFEYPQEIPILTGEVGGERNADREATLRYLITRD